MTKRKTKREFLNDDPSMAGAILTEFSYTTREKDGKKTKELDDIYLSIGDCSRTIMLTFEVADYSKNKKRIEKNVKNSLAKANKIKNHIEEIINALEEYEKELG